MKLYNIKNYAIVRNAVELKQAMKNRLCCYIIWENGHTIYLYTNVCGKWTREKYVFFGEDYETDEETTGSIAYQSFYAYAGRDEVEKMKLILPSIDKWDSNEQMHYANVFHADEKIYKPIYEFDANSAFTYGTMRLPKGFDVLQEYMYGLYEKKRDAKTKAVRSKYKNLQNYLVGYFARVSGFVSTRSEIIGNSNNNILDRMSEIRKKGGIVYLSNTDSIVTDDIGADIMSKYLGLDVGQFKLEGTYDRLYYKSPNSYQLGDKIVWSGVKAFARENTDFFKDRIAEQHGSLLEGYDFAMPTDDENKVRLCRVKFGVIEVRVYHSLGELLDVKEYRIQ